MVTTRAAARMAIVAVLATIGCGIDKGEPDPVSAAQLAGKWKAPIGHDCAFGVTFNADGTFGSGTSCGGWFPHDPPAQKTYRVLVQWITGTFTVDSEGQIDLLPSERACHGDPASYHAEYSEDHARPTITVPLSPTQDVDVPRDSQTPPWSSLSMSPSDSSPLDNETVVHGCFDLDWTFTPLPTNGS
jgi:hypothetical protein